MNDWYTKLLFTLIAISLLVIAADTLSSPARAQLGANCGEYSSSPCYIRIVDEVEIEGEIDTRVRN